MIMSNCGNWNWITIGAIVLIWAGPALGATDAQKCEATKLKVAGKYNFCRLKAEAKAVKTGNPVDYTKCDSKFSTKWGDTDGKYTLTCPTLLDSLAVGDQVTADADFIALKLTGVRFVDNGDGTVTDVDTGLMWEQKTTAVGSGVNLADPHDVDNTYTWSTGTNKPDGWRTRTSSARSTVAHRPTG